MKKSKIYLPILAAITLLASLSANVTTGHIQRTYAAGGSYNLRLTPNKTSQLADGSSLIEFTVYSYLYYCGEDKQSVYLSPDECPEGQEAHERPMSNGDNTLIQVSGSGNTLSNNRPNTNYETGLATFTLKSTVAEAKTVKGVYNSNPSSVRASVSVTFTNPSPPAPEPQPVAVTTNPSPPAPEPQPVAVTTNPSPPAPEPPAIEVPKIIVNNSDLSTQENIVIQENEPFTLSGKTIPNGKITLTIRSNPRIVDLTADEGGDWNYTVEDLEPGDHTVSMQVTDPKTGLSSKEEQVLALTVEPKPVETQQSFGAIETSPESTSSSITPIVILAIIAFISLVAAGGTLFYKKRIKKSSTQSTNPHQPSSNY